MSAPFPSRDDSDDLRDFLWDAEEELKSAEAVGEAPRLDFFDPRLDRLAEEDEW